MFADGFDNDDEMDGDDDRESKVLEGVECVLVSTVVSCMPSMLKVQLCLVAQLGAERGRGEGGEHHN